MSGAGAGAAQPSPDQSGKRLRGLSIKLLILRVGPLLILLILAVVLSLTVPVFMTARNLGNILAQTAVIATVAMGHNDCRGGGSRPEGRDGCRYRHGDRHQGKR